MKLILLSCAILRKDDDMASDNTSERSPPDEGKLDLRDAKLSFRDSMLLEDPDAGLSLDERAALVGIGDISLGCDWPLDANFTCVSSIVSSSGNWT